VDAPPIVNSLRYSEQVAPRGIAIGVFAVVVELGHLAVALNRVGRSADAETLLKSLLVSAATSSDKAEAEKLLQQLKRG